MADTPDRSSLIVVGVAAQLGGLLAHEATDSELREVDELFNSLRPTVPAAVWATAIETMAKMAAHEPGDRPGDCPQCAATSQAWDDLEAAVSADVADDRASASR